MTCFASLHNWNLSPREAIVLQKELRDKVRLETPARIETIAGCDVWFNKSSETIYAGICVLRLSDLTTIEEVAVES